MLLRHVFPARKACRAPPLQTAAQVARAPLKHLRGRRAPRPARLPRAPAASKLSVRKAADAPPELPQYNRAPARRLLPRGQAAREAAVSKVGGRARHRQPLPLGVGPVSRRLLGRLPVRVGRAHASSAPPSERKHACTDECQDGEAREGGQQVCERVRGRRGGRAERRGRRWGERQWRRKRRRRKRRRRCKQWSHKGRRRGKRWRQKGRRWDFRRQANGRRRPGRRGGAATALEGNEEHV